MRLIHTAEFLRSYEKLPPEIRVQTDKQLIFLSRNPRHPSLHVHKRAGERNLWQARMTRSYRLFFAWMAMPSCCLPLNPTRSSYRRESGSLSARASI